MDICAAARAGDLDRVQALIKDDHGLIFERYFDATALYYACYGGHYKVCEFLLECGAVCHEQTFDGDRALYGALTDDIRELLRRYRQRKTVVKTSFEKDIDSLFQNPEKCPADICFVDKVSGKKHWSHKAILSARLPRLFERINADKKIVTLNKKVCFSVFKALVYTYAIHDVVDISMDQVEEFTRMANFLGAAELSKSVDAHIQLLKTKPTLLNRNLKRKNAHENTQVFMPHPLGYNRLSYELGELFSSARHTDASVYCKQSCSKFDVHKCIVFARSDYFRFAFDNADNLADVNYLSDSQHCVKAMLTYLYTDGPGVAQALFLENSGEMQAQEKVQLVENLIDLAARLLLPGLMDFCTKILREQGLIHFSNVYFWLELANLYSIASLQSECFQVIAQGFFSSSGVVDTAMIHEFKAALKDLSTKDRDFQIAQVREAFVESLAGAESFTIDKLDSLTDKFEEITGYQNTIKM